eukprot:540559-Rhodomonas_salina.1
MPRSSSSYAYSLNDSTIAFQYYIFGAKPEEIACLVAMPILRAVRPPSKQCLGDLLFDVLKKQYGDLASKLVGLLLEGKSENELAAALDSKAELERMVSGVLRLLSIQRGIPENDAVTRLGAVLRSESAFHRASAAWSLADLAMEEKWRIEIGERNGVISHLKDLIALVNNGNVHEKASDLRIAVLLRLCLTSVAVPQKNAALCLGNLCCECTTNQVCT